MSTAALREDTRFLVFSADDDRDDQDLLEEALLATGFGFILRRFENGLHLMKEMEKVLLKSAARPDIIFLDLNMPVKNGHEVLLELRDPALGYPPVPVTILTTSNAFEDMHFCRNNGADAYVVKPNNFNELIRLVEKSLRDVLLKSGSSHGEGLW